MFGHPTWNAFALVSPSSRFLIDDTYRCMITRYGPFSKVLWDMRKAMEVNRVDDLQRLNVDERLHEKPETSAGSTGSRRHNSDSGTRSQQSWPQKKPRHSLGETRDFPVPPSVKDWFQTLNFPSSGSQILKVPRNDANGFRVRWPMRND